MPVPIPVPTMAKNTLVWPIPAPQMASARPAALASLSTSAGTPNARAVSAASGKFRQHGRLGGLRMTPWNGSSGPGAQMPIPTTASRAPGTAAKISSIAAPTQANAASAVPAATIGTRDL